MRRIRAALVVAVLGIWAMGAHAEQAVVKTVGGLYEERAALAGQLVSVTGKVVKVNNGIMGRNFVHVQDGTGGPGTDDLTVTSQDTAGIGDQVTVTGRIVLDRVFGSGYTYPLLMEETSIKPAQ